MQKATQLLIQMIDDEHKIVDIVLHAFVLRILNEQLSAPLIFQMSRLALHGYCAEVAPDIGKKRVATTTYRNSATPAKVQLASQNRELQRKTCVVVGWMVAHEQSVGGGGYDIHASS